MRRVRSHPARPSGAAVAGPDALGVPLLGEVPFVPDEARGRDADKPAVEAAPAVAATFDRIARRVWAATELAAAGR